MNIQTNEKLIRRNSAIGRYSALTGMLVLAAGMVFSFRSQDQQFSLLLILLLVGYALSQIGIFFQNRFGPHTRLDEKLNQALKGLNRSYNLYHHTSPASHLLVGPAGVWVLAPRYQRGAITYEKGRYRQKGGGLRLFYMRIFAQEGLGRPDLELQGEVERVEKYLREQLPENDVPPVQGLLVFTHPEAMVEVEEAPFPTMHASKLKTFIRRQAKENRLSATKSQPIKQLLEPG